MRCRTARGLVFILASLTGPWLAAEELPFKQLAGPPAEFAEIAAADPSLVPTESASAVIEIALEAAADGTWTWTGTLAVERDRLRFAVVSPLISSDADGWGVLFRDPSTKRLQTPEELGIERRRSNVGEGVRGVPAEVFELMNARRGRREIVVRSSRPGRAMLISEGDGALRLSSHPRRWNQRVGTRVAIVADLLDSEGHGRGRAAGQVTTAQLRVKGPEGSTIAVPMSDDGLSEDGAAGDGLYGATFVPHRAGDFIAQVVVDGVDRGQSEFVRTTQHLIPVVDETLALPEQIAVASLAGDRLDIAIRVSSSRPGRHYRVFAEVWGVSSGGSTVPVAWIGGMSRVNDNTLHTSLDTRWIALAGASAPFELRNVRIEEPDSFVQLAEDDVVPLSTPVLPKSASVQAIVIDEAMRMGPRPSSQAFAKLRASSQAYTSGTGHKLLLVHGYCSGDAWGPVAGQFTNAAVFLDLGQSRSHDAFAQRILAFGSQWNSYAIVAHSQGGMAALHLNTYYWSGLDNAGAGRLIQSVGTPYQGTPLAGNLAVLGQLFGAGCGSNGDLTYEGAQAWLAGIPSSSRAGVNYYTTSFTDGWFYDYCNLVTDLLLSDPDDGVVEQSRAQLPGAVNRGHVTGWCHTSGMRDPAQVTDAVRNAAMNTNAATGPPAVTTGVATSIGQFTATLTGTVNPSGSTTSTAFEYGTSGAYGSVVAAQTFGGFATQVISAAPALSCGTTYHYRARATNAVGTRYGAGQTLTTQACPCSTFSITPASATAPSPAGSQTVSIAGSPAGCQGGNWTATGNGSWLTVLPQNGTGPGSVTVSWTAATAARSGQGTIAGNTFTLTQSGPGAALRSRADFNGDGRSEIVLQNTNTGLIRSWTLDPTTLSLTRNAAIAGVPDAAWKLVSTGDFDGDGRSDLLLRNSSTGDIVVFLMNDLVVTGAAVVITPGTAWRVIGAGELNGDGRADVLLQSTEGTLAVLIMNGLTVSAITTPGSLALTGFDSVALGDLDGDGRAEIVLQHTAGDIAMWKLTADATAVASGAWLLNGGTAWQVAAAADLDGDGRAEILAQNTASRDVAIVHLDAGGSAYAAAYVIPAQTASMVVMGTGDFDGDGRSEVVLHDSATADVATWRLNATADGVSTRATETAGVNDVPVMK